MGIQVLDADVAAKIAAGEVIERPASVVKELVENAIDAGASEIRIEIRNGGQREIRIVDNGSGIPAGEVELAFQRHATSKLRDADDLFDVHTLGFRGEALPSIATIAQVTCISRTADAPTGIELRIAGGEVQSSTPRGGSAGTTFVIKNLFYNTPARLKFLRSEATEAAQINSVIEHYALAYPEIRWVLLVDGRLSLQTPGSGSLLDAIMELYGIDRSAPTDRRRRRRGRRDRSNARRGLCQPAVAHPFGALVDPSVRQPALGARQRPTGVCDRGSVSQLADEGPPSTGDLEHRRSSIGGRRQRSPDQSRGEVSASATGAGAAGPGGARRPGRADRDSAISRFRATARTKRCSAVSSCASSAPSAPRPAAIGRSRRYRPRSRRPRPTSGRVGSRPSRRCRPTLRSTTPNRLPASSPNPSMAPKRRRLSRARHPRSPRRCQARALPLCPRAPRHRRWKRACRPCGSWAR